MSKRYFKSLVLSLLTMLFILIPGVSADAKALDEIVSYAMQIDIQDNADALITYDIQWKVLDSKSEGPLSWVQIGLPSSDCDALSALSENIRSIEISRSGGTYAKVTFDRDYYKDEIVHFSFSVVQKHIYEYNPDNDYAIYTFTPGWFDGIDVDSITIRWNADNVLGVSPACTVEQGYYEWTSSLKSGEKMTVTVKYPNDSYAFEVYESSDSYDYEFSEHTWYENIGEVILIIIGMFFIVVMIALPFAIPALVIFTAYKALTGFTVGKDKKITRTVIEYYPSCPNCGGSRGKDEDKCMYCGSDMIKSKDIITEEELSKLDKTASGYRENGTYQFASNPNKYVRVNVVTVPHVVSRTPSSGSSGRSSSGRSHSSSCAHSSCACACACACAGGGRAGCSTKDFYNTNLKLRYLLHK